jgi:hypothetical protein
VCIILFNHRTYESAGSAPWSPEVHKHSRVVLENVPEFLEPNRESQLSVFIQGSWPEVFERGNWIFLPFYFCDSHFDGITLLERVV